MKALEFLEGFRVFCGKSAGIQQDYQDVGREMRFFGKIIKFSGFGDPLLAGAGAGTVVSGRELGKELRFLREDGQMLGKKMWNFQEDGQGGFEEMRFFQQDGQHFGFLAIPFRGGGGRGQD